jgi:hypothetical protein
MNPPRKGEPTGLAAMITAGGRTVSEYTGMVLGLYAVQALVAGGVAIVVAQLLTGAFADRPILDDAVDGDLVALIEVVRGAPMLFASIQALVVGAVFLWLMLSWFLTGGLLGVLVERPRGRRETARAFGAAGAATFFVYLRVGLVSAILHMALVMPALVIGTTAALPHVEGALTGGELVVGMVIALGPALLAAALIGVVTDYARVELTLRRPSHDGLGALRAVARAVMFVCRRPVAIGHRLLGWLAFFAVSAIYGWAAHGHPMLGTGGAISLLVLRQVLSLLRLAINVGVLGGQVELSTTRPPPPRQVVDGV